MTGEILNDLIKNKGVKQKFIADKMGVSEALLSQWKLGQTPIAPHHVKELKKLLK